MLEQRSQAEARGKKMRPVILGAGAAFILGLTVGRLSLGQAPAPEAHLTPSPGAATEALSALSITPAGPAKASRGASASGERTPVGDWTVDQSGDAAITAGADHALAPNSSGDGLQALVRRLEARVGKLEHKLAKLESEQAERPEDASDTRERARAAATAGDRRSALITAGVPEPAADDIVWRQSTWDLERLELQDQAIREGWHRTERYYQALRDLEQDAVDFRTEIGDQAYDRYLYQTGEDNRVRVASVIPGSEAELAGLAPGDIIESYGDGRIFNFTDLRNSTATGERGELVPVVIQRGDLFIEALVPRGPLGVRIEADRLPPNE
jgi:hypothetical protein